MSFAIVQTGGMYLVLVNVLHEEEEDNVSNVIVTAIDVQQALPRLLRHEVHASPHPSHGDIRSWNSHACETEYETLNALILIRPDGHIAM